MGKFQIKTYEMYGNYYKEMREIYDQFVISKGGFFNERNCLIDYVANDANKNRRKLYTACAFIDEKLVGFVMLSQKFSRKDELYVSLIAVDKDHQGQGIGKALMNYAIHHSNGYARIASGAYLKNTASLKLHRKAGFSVLSSHIHKSGEHAGETYLRFVRKPPIIKSSLKCEEKEME